MATSGISNGKSLRLYLEQSHCNNENGHIECSLETSLFPEPPASFICPLSNEIMTDPVRVPGYPAVSFERSYCEKWLMATTMVMPKPTTSSSADATTSQIITPVKSGNSTGMSMRKRRIPISPYTGAPLTTKELVSNRTLKWKINSWKKQREFSIRNYMELDDAFSTFSESSGISSMESFESHDTSSTKPWKVMML